MNIIQGGRWDGFLRRLFSLKEGTVAPSVAPDIWPVLQIQPPAASDEYLRGGRLWVGYATAGAVAAQRSFSGLWNPADSGVLVEVEHTNVFSDVNGLYTDLHIVIAAPGATTLTFMYPRDTRVRYSSTSASAQLYQGAQAGSLTFPCYRIYLNTAFVEKEYRQPIVLPPGVGVFWQHLSVNIQCNSNWTWRERAISPSEL